MTKGGRKEIPEIDPTHIGIIPPDVLKEHCLFRRRNTPPRFGGDEAAEINSPAGIPRPSVGGVVY